MPADVLALLTARDLLSDYHERPAYQQNDYLAWIGQVKREATRNKRIGQMIEELRTGGVYMGMPHAPSRKA